MPEAGEEARSRIAILRHPLFVGAAVAMFSGVLASLLLPAITRVWQDRPRELELKLGLVERISRTATETIENGNRFARFAKTFETRSERNALLNSSLHTWRVESSIMDSELATYFHGTPLPDRWQEFDRAVDAFLEFEAYDAWLIGPGQHERDRHGDEATRQLDLATLVSHFRSMSFRDADAESTRQTFLQGLDELRIVRNALPRLLLAERDQPETQIVESAAAGFSHGFWIFR
jgi:hypothetical protein